MSRKCFINISTNKATLVPGTRNYLVVTDEFFELVSMNNDM